LIFVLASLGLPGLGNFIAEILILFGSFFANRTLTIIATFGLVAATIYSLRIMQKIFYGKERTQWKVADLNLREMVIMVSLTAVIIWLGIFPSSILDISRSPVQNVIEKVNGTTTNRGTQQYSHVEKKVNNCSINLAVFKDNSAHIK